VNSIRLISNREGRVELPNWHLPPKYMDLFDNSKDIFKELYIKCNVDKNIILILISYQASRKSTEKDNAKIR
jgi:hypothetical protein